VSVCQDSLGAFEAGPGTEPVVKVMVDAALASATAGEAGAEIVAGPRVGPGLLAELLCTGRIEANLTREDGTVVGLGDSASAIPPRLRRHVLARGGGCTVAGCRSRYRLQVHHLVERSRGGSNHPDNLTTLCWMHHHVAVHRLGFRVDPASPPGRRRLIPPHRPRAPD
jgi:5-methylcytosine-specific restriction endonuclease McrA